MLQIICVAVTLTTGHGNLVPKFEELVPLRKTRFISATVRLSMPWPLPIPIFDVKKLVPVRVIRLPTTTGSAGATTDTTVGVSEASYTAAQPFNWLAELIAVGLMGSNCPNQPGVLNR